MTVTFKDTTVVFSQTILIPPSEPLVTVVAALGNSSITLKIEFVMDESAPELGLSWAPMQEGGAVRMTFRNWNNSLGTSLNEMHKLGASDGRDILFLVAHQLVGKVHALHLSLYWKN
jgi:hypothetical protein